MGICSTPEVAVLRITAEQVAVLRRTTTASFLDRVVAFLREHFADAREMPSRDLRTEVRQQASKAYSYGLTTEQEIVSYVVAAKFLGERFDCHVGVQKHLGCNRTSSHKAKFLEGLVKTASRRADSLRQRAD